jgi:hypothetical protein
MCVVVLTDVDRLVAEDRPRPSPVGFELPLSAAPEAFERALDPTVTKGVVRVGAPAAADSPR